MSANEKGQLFDEKLHKYEEKLVDFFTDIGQQKRVNPKYIKMSSYLLLHKKLTQKQLKELTGYSLGTISTFLSVMLGTGYYEKKRIQGTHTYTYQYQGNIADFTTRGIEIALNALLDSETILRKKQNELKILMEQKRKGASHLSKRIDEILRMLNFYAEFFPKIMHDELGEK